MSKYEVFLGPYFALQENADQKNPLFGRSSRNDGETKQHVEQPAISRRMVCFTSNFQSYKTSAILSVLNFFVLLKDICKKTNFFKILKDRHLLVDGCCTNIIFRLFLGIEVHFTKNANSLLWSN